MIEIILGIWVVCFFLSIMVLGINFHLMRKRLGSEKLKNLNMNLKKINMYWSNTAEDFLPLDSDSINKDEEKTLRNALFMGFFALGSLPGFILLFILILSIHFLAPSRKTVATFNSALAQKNALSQEEVQNLVKQLSQIY